MRLGNVGRRVGRWVRCFSPEIRAEEYSLEFMDVSCTRSSQLAFLSLRELRTAYQNGEVNAPEITDIMLSRIKQLQDELKFMISTPNQARSQAEAMLDADDPNKSLLYAVPFSVKDTRWKKPPWYFPEVAAAAILLGYNNMPWVGQCANPYDMSRTATGSAGGSAVAVATGCSYFAVATDGMGSIRYPASANGAVGVVPDNRSSIFASGKGARAGILARSVEDAAIVCGEEFLLSLETDSDQPLKVAVFDGGDLCAEEIRVEFNAAVNKLAFKDSRLSLSPIPRLVDFDFATALHRVGRVRGQDAFKANKVTPASLETTDPAAAAFLRSPGPTPQEFEFAECQLDSCDNILQSIFAKHDVILQPTLFCDPWPKGQAHADVNRPCSWSQAAIYNFSGHAAGSMPFAMSAAGVPMGLHIAVKHCGKAGIGGINSTALLLQVMRRIEKALRFTVPPPFMPRLTYGVGRPILPFLEKKPEHKCCK